MNYHLLKAIANVLHDVHHPRVKELIRIQLVSLPVFEETSGDGQLLRNLFHALHPQEVLTQKKATLYANLLDDLVTRKDP